MKVILKIARQELETLFFSPIAWLILIIFAVQCGISFTDKLAIFEANQYGGTNLEQLSIYMFSSNSGFFGQIQKHLYLYIPLLTMGLMSRETSSGTIKLLFSSPVKISAIIFGKYLSMVVYGALLSFIMVLICLGGVYSIANIDLGILFSGMLGLYLLICAYAAIGLYMSCLTSYQMIAALSTLVVLGILSYIGGVWQNVAFVRDLTYFLSINGRASHMFFGLISSKDLLYFVLVITFFILLAIMKLQDDRRARGIYAALGRYTGLFATILLFGYISSRPAFTAYADVTTLKSNTLTENSQKIIAQLDKPMVINSYINIMDGGAYLGLPASQISDAEHFERYIRFKPDIKINYIYYYDMPLDGPNPFKDHKELVEKAKRKAQAERMDFDKILSPAEIRKVIDLRPEQNRFVREINYDGKKVFLRMFNDPDAYPFEQEISVVLKKLLVKSPKIGFITGHDEPDLESMGDQHYYFTIAARSSRSALMNLGYDLCNISLSAKIPEDVDVLVLADPRNSLTAAELGNLDQFIERGGSMLIAGEPGRQSILNPVIKPLGLEFLPGMIIQDTKDIALNYALSHFSPEASKIKSFAHVSSFPAPVALSGAVALRYTPDTSFQATPMLITDPAHNWNRLRPLTGDSLRLTYQPSAGDQRTVLPLAYALDRQQQGKQQRIMVIGDATFFSNGEMSRQNVAKANFEFTHNIFGWLTGDIFPVDVSRPATQDNLLTINRNTVSMFQLFYLGILPGLIGVAGAILLIRRKRT
ncbi:Gldg family protein [Pedobacter sp. AW31-3R]|uniref:Gldg family protein n=1 Tax=Pedobacter sp. AW31-3R TaxID=3445781 RepID=UPI003F9F633E